MSEPKKVCSKRHAALHLTLTVGGALLLSGVSPSPAYAQTTSGTISGNISDPSGASVAGAPVTVKQEERDFTQAATTDREGHFVFQQLPPGRYTLDINASGFKSYDQKNIFF